MKVIRVLGKLFLMKSFWALSLLFTFSLIANAQTSTSKLTGIIYDQTGAIIVGANVTVIGVDGKKFKTVSSDSGEYTLTLPVNKNNSTRRFVASKYDIVVESPGFRRSETKGYIFFSSQFGAMRIDIGLEVGEIRD